MSDRRLSVRLTRQLREELESLASQRGVNESQIVRQALEQYCRDQAATQSAYELAHEIRLIGSADDLPSDLSTNPKHFEGFGRG